MQKRHRQISGLKREKRPRINEEIRVPEVRLVTESGAEVLSVEEALQKARAAELDLIEVSPKARPPVVKLDDFGRYRYRMQKKEKQQKAHNKQTEIKMLRLSFRTEQHDRDRLLERAREFFEDGHLVKFAMRLRGREIANKEYAREKMNSMVRGLTEVSEVEQEIKQQGNQYIVILRPKR